MVVEVPILVYSTLVHQFCTVHYSTLLLCSIGTAPCSSVLYSHSTVSYRTALVLQPPVLPRPTVTGTVVYCNKMCGLLDMVCYNPLYNRGCCVLAYFSMISALGIIGNKKANKSFSCGLYWGTSCSGVEFHFSTVQCFFALVLRGGLRVTRTGCR